MSLSQVGSERHTHGPLSEIEAIQNPAVGAYLLWRLGVAFQKNSPHSPLLGVQFLTLPLLLHRPTLAVITSTKPSSGLHKFVEKMLTKESDLIGLNTRALDLRDLTLASLSLGIATGLLKIDHEHALVYSLEEKTMPAVSEELANMQKGAERLGKWFSEIGSAQIFSMLRVAS